MIWWFIDFQEELERFPVDVLHEPTAILKNDRREIYNNLVLFSIMDDPGKRNSDMHIFQSITSPVSSRHFNKLCTSVVA